MRDEQFSNPLTMLISWLIYSIFHCSHNGLLWLFAKKFSVCVWVWEFSVPLIWLLSYTTSCISIAMLYQWITVVVATPECTVWHCPDGQKVLITSQVLQLPAHLQTTAGTQFSLTGTGSWWTAIGQHATCRLRETRQRALSTSKCVSFAV